MSHPLNVDRAKVLFISLFICLTAKGLAQSCNNWLHLPSYMSYVSVGDLDVPGDQITVEATFMRTTPYTGGQIWAGDLVSKHVHPTDANYLLRPNNAEITTTNGYFRTPDICEIELNKTYHAAMVYDGKILKFYRNGFLMSSVAATGDLFQNDFETRIGLYDALLHNTNLIGYINEVRIWNVARSQAQIRAYMNTSMPSPTTQAGLQAYYKFDNLLNKQGNANWNGVLGGAAAINQTIVNCTFVADSCALRPTGNVNADFTIPDTVCVNTPVKITNNSVGASSYFWNFCVGGISTTPSGTNLGNLGGKFSMPVFIDYAYYNGNYYGFLINFNPGKLIRLNFGNSLLNTPTTTDLGDLNGVIPLLAEGIQVVYNEGRWYAIVLAGYTAQGLTPRIVKVDFGPNLTNTTPIITNWGNLGNMQQPIDLHVFQENGNWYGLTVNAENNTITRFNFTNSFNNTPTAVNLGNIGNLRYPTGIYAINDDNFWRVFVVNGGNNSRTNGTWSLTRLDFGSSLLNTPTGVNLGNPGGMLKHPRDLTIMKFCGETIGFVVNGAIGSSDIVKLDFNKDLSSTPTMSSLGNIGNLDFPHSIAKIFRVGADLYSFITNVGNNSITRLQFSGCNSSSIPNSSLQNPPSILYNTAGTYNINLTVDDGLPTQESVCKQVVVLPPLEHKPIQDIKVCQGTSIKLGSSSKLGTHLWNTGSKADSIVVNANGIYWVETDRYGCTNRDSFSVTITPPFTVNLGPDKTICSGNVTLDAGLAADSYLWNTGNVTKAITVDTSGTYIVKVKRNSCEATDTIKITRLGFSNFDFNYQQNTCDPLRIQFNSKATGASSIYWNFGDGDILTGNLNPEHIFKTAGNFPVKLALTNSNCTDTIQKSMVVNWTYDNIILTPDTVSCYKSSKQLRTVPAANFCWSPVTFLDNPNSPNPVTLATQDITYYFTAEMTGPDLITNGNFSSGNSGFSSQYSYSNAHSLTGQYFVGPDPKLWDAGFSACSDHTGNRGNMMMVSGKSSSSMEVWKQTVNVLPNTNYAFSVWLQSVAARAGPQLQLSINGNEMGSLMTAGPACSWKKSNLTWNSGTSTVVELVLTSKATVDGSNFALDDIYFSPIFIKRDSVIIKVEKPVVKTIGDTTICAGKNVQLFANGAQTYIWTPAQGLSDSRVADPLANPVIATQYIVTGTTNSGCIAKDTVNVSVYGKPTIVSIRDTAICKNNRVQLSATNGVTYNWWPGNSLSNQYISNPIASPGNDTKYYVTVKDANNCEHLDSVMVTVKPEAVFTLSGPDRICKNDSLQLIAAGGDQYHWYPAEGLKQTSIPDPYVSPESTTEYTVEISESVCGQSAVLSKRLTVLPPPLITTSKSNDIDCSNDRSQLKASGARTYSWTPVSTLNNAAIFNPQAKPFVTTEYIVRGADAEGCIAYDTVIVKVENVNKSGYLMPNAFTPNNDGMNDCFGVKYWGIINEFEFSVYTRWGERIFFTKDPAGCWDGTYKGVSQDGGVYVYQIRAKTNCEPEVYKKGTVVLIR